MTSVHVSTHFRQALNAVAHDQNRYTATQMSAFVPGYAGYYVDSPTHTSWLGPDLGSQYSCGKPVPGYQVVSTRTLHSPVGQTL
jgi:hypothetical protein